MMGSNRLSPFDPGRLDATGYQVERDSHQVVQQYDAAPASVIVQQRSDPESSLAATIILHLLGLAGWIVFIVGLLKMLMLVNGYTLETNPDLVEFPGSSETAPVQSVPPVVPDNAETELV